MTATTTSVAAPLGDGRETAAGPGLGKTQPVAALTPQQSLPPTAATNRR